MEAPGRPVLVLSFAGSRVVVSSSRLEESGLMGLRTGHRWSTLTGVSSKPSRQSDEAPVCYIVGISRLRECH